VAAVIGGGGAYSTRQLSGQDSQVRACSYLTASFLRRVADAPGWRALGKGVITPQRRLCRKPCRHHPTA
jgi:hypothetical protein